MSTAREDAEVIHDCVVHMQAVLGDPREDVSWEVDEVLKATKRLVERIGSLRATLARAAFVAEHLLIACESSSTGWTGVFGPEGQSEDAYLNAKLAEEIKGWVAPVDEDDEFARHAHLALPPPERSTLADDLPGSY